MCILIFTNYKFNVNFSNNNVICQYSFFNLVTIIAQLLVDTLNLIKGYLVFSVIKLNKIFELVVNFYFFPIIYQFSIFFEVLAVAVISEQVLPLPYVNNVLWNFMYFLLKMIYY